MWRFPRKTYFEVAESTYLYNADTFESIWTESFIKIKTKNKFDFERETALRSNMKYFFIICS